MPQVPVAQNTVGLAEMTGAKLQPADFGAAGEMIGRAVEQFGQQGSQFAEQQAAFEKNAAMLEANKFELKHIEATHEIGATVREARGAAAGGVSLQATTDLQNLTKKLLEGASPRVRRILEPKLLERNAATIDSFREHAFTQTSDALVTSSKAIINQALDSAVAEPDETKARGLLTPVFHQNEMLADSLGWTAETKRDQNRAAVSDFIAGRAHLIGKEDPKKALQYANDHHDELGREKFENVVDAFTGPAREQGSSDYADQHPELFSGVPGFGAAVSSQYAPNAVPSNLAASGSKLQGIVAHIESGGQGDWKSPGVPLTSSAGAKYAMQVMPSTAAKPGYGIRPAASDTPEEYNRVGRELLAKMQDRYHGDPLKAAAAYHSGAGTVDRLVRERGADWSSGLGHFGQDYVGKTLAALGGAGGGVQVASNDPLAAPAPSSTGSSGPATFATVSARIDALPNLSYEDKKALKNEAKSRINEYHAARADTEEEAARAATDQVVHLDKGFTSTRQISNWADLSPSMRETLQNRAESNKKRNEEAPLTPELSTLINFTRLANPQKFISPAFQQELLHRGAPMSAIRAVAGEAGTLAGTIAAQKPDPLSGSEIWTIAKPAFEASGLFLDHQEASGKEAKSKERMADAARKNTAISFLRDLAATWALANPGKKPDESLVRGWAGQALLRANSNPASRTVFESDPHSVVTAMSPTQRAGAVKSLQRSGIAPTEANLYKWYKAMLALHSRPQ